MNARRGRPTHRRGEQRTEASSLLRCALSKAKRGRLRCKPDAAGGRSVAAGTPEGRGQVLDCPGSPRGDLGRPAGLTLARPAPSASLVFTGASQFALVGALAAGGQPARRGGGGLLPGRAQRLLRAAPVAVAGPPARGAAVRRAVGHRRDDGRGPRAAHAARRPDRVHRHRTHPGTSPVEPHHTARRTGRGGHRGHRRLGAGRGRSPRSSSRCSRRC